MKIALKQIRNPNTSKCLDSPVDKASMQAAINLWPCHNMGGNQVYNISWTSVGADACIQTVTNRFYL